MTSINEWIDLVTDGSSDREIARLAQIGQSTLSRQRRDTTVTVETAVKIARAYQVSVIPALISLGIVTESDISDFASAAAIQDATDTALADEVLKRMRAGSELMNAPISHVVEATKHMDGSDLDSRRKAKAAADPAEVDDDAIIAGIAAGTEKYAAQKRTPPLEENFT